MLADNAQVVDDLRAECARLREDLRISDQIRTELHGSLVQASAVAERAIARVQLSRQVVERALAWNADPNRVNACFALAEACDAFVAGQPS